MKKTFILLVVAIISISCDRELARVDLLKENSKEVFFDLEAEEVIDLYVDIDIVFKETPLFVYHCALKQDGSLLFEGGTDPLTTTLNENESKVTTIDGLTHWKFFGKLDGDLKASKDDIYSIKTTFLKNEDPNLIVKKAQIVFLK